MRVNVRNVGWRGAVAAVAVLAAGPAVLVMDGRPPPARATLARAAAPAARDGHAPEAFRAPRITRFLGERRLPHLMRFQGTTVGGISGFDRDPRTGAWAFISDDRWRYDPARFYTGRLRFDAGSGAFTGVELTGVTTFRRPDGTPYPGFGKPDSVDPESIRVDPGGGRLLWGQEGDRPDEKHPSTPLSAMSLRWAGRDGAYQGELPLPPNLRLTTEHRGPRRNYGFEGLTFTPHGVAAILEGPRYEDGGPPTAERGATTRLTVWDRRGRARAQYAYPVDRLPPAPAGDSDSGVSEILAVDDHRFLALERSWQEGAGYGVKLYAFDVRGATDVLAADSLAAAPGYRPVAKRLVADLGRYAAPVQNLEGMAWGPRLRSGECTLVVGSDDNFDDHEVTQFLAFAVRGC